MIQKLFIKLDILGGIEVVDILVKLQKVEKRNPDFFNFLGSWPFFGFRGPYPGFGGPYPGFGGPYPGF